MIWIVHKCRGKWPSFTPVWYFGSIFFHHWPFLLHVFQTYFILQQQRPAMISVSILKFNIFYKFINHYFYLKFFFICFQLIYGMYFSIYKCWYILANTEKFNITCIKCKCKHGLSSFRINSRKASSCWSNSGQFFL